MQNTCYQQVSTGENSDKNITPKKVEENSKVISKNTSKEQITFRNIVIDWETYIDPKTGQKSNLICYNGNKYSIDKFFKSIYKEEYKKHDKVLKFKNDNIYYIGGSQRDKLQYEALIYDLHKNGLTLYNTDKNDEIELKEFFNSNKEQSIQQLTNRMYWEYGLDTMITFGVSKSVKGINRSVWCYNIENTKTGRIYKGVKMSWEKWVKRYKAIIEAEIEQSALKSRLDYYDIAFINFYYQDTKYLTLTGKENKEIRIWIYNYLKDKTTSFPYSGELPLSDLQFTIDYEIDIEYIKSHENKHNKDIIGRDKAYIKFSKLKGDRWTKKELIELGYNDGNITRYKKYGFIDGDGKGNYWRLIE